MRGNFIYKDFTQGFYTMSVMSQKDDMTLIHLLLHLLIINIIPMLKISLNCPNYSFWSDYFWRVFNIKYNLLKLTLAVFIKCKYSEQILPKIVFNIILYLIIFNKIYLVYFRIK